MSSSKTTASKTAAPLDDKDLDAATGGAIFAKFDGIDGEATDSRHKDWIIIESMSSPIYRSIPEGKK